MTPTMTPTTTAPELRAPLRARGMLAGAVAKALGVGVQTLHYYEREGLIPPPERSASGYRLYTQKRAERVGFIRRAQALGLPLDEIRDVLRLADQGASPCGRVQAALADTLAEVDRRLAELEHFRQELAGLVARAAALSAEGGGQVCAILEDATPLGTGVGHAPLAPAGRAPRPARRRGGR